MYLKNNDFQIYNNQKEVSFPVITENTELEQLIENNLLFQKLISNYDSAVLKVFLIESIRFYSEHSNGNTEYHMGDHMEGLYAIYKENIQDFFAWIVPCIRESINQVEEIEKERQYDRINEQQNRTSDKSNNGFGVLSTDIITVGEKPVHGTTKEISPSDKNLDGYRKITDENEGVGQSGRRYDFENEESVDQAFFNEQICGPSNSSSSRGKDFRTIKYMIQNDTEQPYCLCLNDNGRYLQKESECKEDTYILGRFANYKECSDACCMWDRLSKEAQSLYVRVDKKEQVTCREQFEEEYKEYHNIKTFFVCEYKIYQDILKKAEESGRLLSIDELATLFLVRAIQHTANMNLNEFVKEVFESSNATIESKKTFVNKLFRNQLITYNEWGIGKFDKEKEESFLIHIYPYGLTGYTDIHEVISMDVQVDRVVEILEQIVADPVYVVENLSVYTVEDHKVEGKFYKDYLKFKKRYNVENRYVCTKEYQSEGASNISKEEDQIDMFGYLNHKHKKR